MKSKTTKVRRYLAAILTVLMIFQQATTSVIYASSEAAVPTVTEAPAAQTEEAPEKQVEETPEEKIPTEGENEGEESATPTEAPAENEAEPEVTVTPAAEPTATEAPTVEATATPVPETTEVPEATPTEVPTAASFTTADGIASVNLTQPISANAKFVATAQDADSDYFYNNVDAAMGAWVESNGLSVVDATAYDMHFEADGQELAVNQSATVHINFPAPILTQKPETGIQTTYYVLHIKNGTAVPAGTVNGDANGAYSADITTDGFSPFVFVKAASGDAIQKTDVIRNLENYLEKDSCTFYVNDQKITDLNNVNLKYKDTLKLFLSWKVPNSIRDLASTDSFEYTLPIKFEQKSNGKLMNGLTPVGDYTISGSKLAFSYYPAFISGGNNIQGTLELEAVITKEITNKENGGEVRWVFPGIGTIVGHVERDTSGDTVSIDKSIDNTDKNSLNNKKVTITVKSTGSNNNVSVNDVMGQYLSVVGGITSSSFTVTDKNNNNVPFTVSGTDGNFDIFLGNMKNGNEIKVIYYVNVDNNACNQNRYDNSWNDELKNTANAKVDGSQKASVSAYVFLNKNWIQKSGTYNKDDNEVTWTIKVNEGVPLDIVGAKIKDALGANQEYVKNSFNVTPAVSGLTWESLSSETGFVFPGGSDKAYTITYKTKPTAADLAYNSSSVSNKVDITPSGSNTPISSGNQWVEVGTGYSFISKQCLTNPNPGQAQEVEWKTIVKVPANQGTVNGAILKDTFASEMELVDGSVKKNGESITVTSLTNEHGFKYTWDIQNSDKEQQFEFTYKTRITTPPTTGAKDYNNKAQFLTSKFGTKEANANYKYEVKKQAPAAYKWNADQNTKNWFPEPSDPSKEGIFTWVVEVQNGSYDVIKEAVQKDKNDNKKTTLKLVDTLPNNHTYIEGSAYIVKNAQNNGWKTERNSITPAISEDGKTLTFDVSDRIDLYTNGGTPGIYYKTKVKNSTGTTTSYTNTAQWELNGVLGAEGTSTQSITLHDKYIYKSYEYDRDTAPRIKYTVEVNKDSLILNEGKPYTLDDNAGSAIDIQFDTLKVDGQTWTDYSFDTTTRIFAVKNILDGESHTITYEGVVNLLPGTNFSNGNGSNTITFSGKSESKYSAQTEITGEVLKSRGTSSNEVRSITIFKYGNGEVNHPLKDVEFTLDDMHLTDVNGVTKVDTSKAAQSSRKGTTNNDGKLTFNVLFDHVYLLKETKTIEGYEIDSEYKNGIYIVFAGNDNKTYDSNIRVLDKNTAFYTLNINNNNNEKKTVSVKKIWNDATNQDGLRPQSIQVQLYADGKESGTPVVLTSDSGWTYTWRDLAEKNGGKAITYTVKEVENVTGYTASEPTGNAEQGFVITNSHTPETIKVEGSKSWKDNDDQDGKRPGSIKVNLFANGKLKESKTVTAKDNWKYSFTDLPKYENGTAINYTVTEDAVADYSTTINGYDIINTYTPGQTSVTVTKAWVDNDNKGNKRPSEIKVQLYAGEQTSGAPVTLNEKNKWTHTWTDLDEKKNGTTISYTVKEVGTAEGYEASVSGDARTGYTITNTLKSGTLEIVKSITGDISDSALTAEQKAAMTFKVTGPNGYSETVHYNDFANGKYTFQNLPLGEYTVTETNADMEGYKLTTTYNVDGGKVTVTNEKTASITITNNYTKILVKISKVDATNQKELEGAHIQVIGKDDKIVDEWTSGKEPHVVKNLKPGETYTLRETVAPNGYYLKADTTFTLKEDGSIDKENTTTTISKEGILLVEDTAIPTPDVPSGPTAKISKVDVTSQQELEGAKLQVIDKNGNVVDEWISGKTAHVTTELKAGETYTLRETVAPDGYLITSDTTFTLKEDGTVDESKTTTKVKDGVLLVEDTKAVSVNISKVDATNQKELEGAHIQIVDKDGKIVDEWTSGKEPHVVKNLKPGETYTLRETVAPDGYTVTSDTTFTLKEDGTVDQTKTTAKVSDKGVVLVEDNMTSVSISKVDITSQKELAGAHIQILDKDGNVVEEWDSTDKAHTIKGLKTGETYTLRETVAPNGYYLKADTTFTLKADGSIDTENTTTTISSNGVLLVEDTQKTVKTQISKVDADTYEVLGGAHLQVIDPDGKVVAEWDSDKEAYTLTDLKPGVVYTLHETAAPKGYKVAEDTTFQLNEDGTIDTANTTTAISEDTLLVKDEKKESKDVSVSVTKKLVTVDGTVIGAEDATYYVALYSDADCTQRVSDVLALNFKNASASTVTFTGLEKGQTYYVGECESDGTCYLANICADGTMYMVDFSDGNAVTVDNADGSTTVYFDNQFENIPDGYYKEAELNITKKLVGSDGKAKNSNEIFYAGIFADEGFTQLSTDVSENIVPLDLAGGSEATAQVNVALPESGSITLYVTEVDSNGKPVAGAASFKYDVTVDNAQVTLNDDNLSANVVITNTENSTKVTPTPGTPNTPNTTGGFSGKSAVRTGDSTPIGGFIALFAAAAVIAGAAVFFKRRRKDEK